MRDKKNKLFEKLVELKKTNTKKLLQLRHLHEFFKIKIVYTDTQHKLLSPYLLIKSLMKICTYTYCLA